MTTLSASGRVARATAAVAAVTAVLTGCAVGDAASVHTSPSTAITPSDSPETAEGSVNALTVTGPSQAAEVDDMSPVTDAAVHLPAHVTDATGERISVTSAERVLSLDLYGTLTDTVIGLGLDRLLVGRAVSDTQERLAELPVVSDGGIGLNVEAVLNLDPDLVLTNTTIGSQRDYEQLEDAGVTVVRFEEVPSLTDIGVTIVRVGAVFGADEAAEKLAATTKQDLASAERYVDELRAATPREPRAVVIYLRGTGGIFFVLGPGYGAADTLEALGLDDVASSAGIDTLVPASAETLAQLNPEIILTMTDGVESAGGMDALLARPGVAATVAGQNERIVTADDSQLLSYGPRTPQTLRALADAVYAAS